jgi:hypothetical protein
VPGLGWIHHRSSSPCFQVENLETLKQVILDFIAYCNQTAKAIQWSCTVEKLELSI